jgi:hypothetical protein
VVVVVGARAKLRCVAAAVVVVVVEGALFVRVDMRSTGGEGKKRKPRGSPFAWGASDGACGLRCRWLAGDAVWLLQQLMRDKK